MCRASSRLQTPTLTYESPSYSFMAAKKWVNIIVTAVTFTTAMTLAGALVTVYF